MAILTVASRADQTFILPVILGTTFVSHKNPAHHIDIEYEDVESLCEGARVCLTTDKGQHIVDGAIASYLMNVLDTSPCKGTHITEWIHRSTHLAEPDLESLAQPLQQLEAHLTLRSHIVGYSLTLADLAVWGVLRSNDAVHDLAETYVNIERWFTFIEASNPWIAAAVEDLCSAPGRTKAPDPDTASAAPTSPGLRIGLKRTASSFARLVKPALHRSSSTISPP